MSNHLKNETSPYLLQHAENPVDWYPWCREAFEKAKAEDRPIFLSIGYSACHWCHVMEKESFEDAETAALLNRYFVSIKVDKEERPDIDSVYMAVCQTLTGSGGWPMSIFMTPEQKPFYAGTYFPKRDRYGSVGFQELLLAIHEKWIGNRGALLRSAYEITEALKRQTHSSTEPDVQLIASALDTFRRSYDESFGGFGQAPKFPAPHILLFLLSHYKKSGEHSSLEMVENTLSQMYRGGLFDHIGYGFCRYSTDRYFLVPHFEKMLYDNALLISAYCAAYRLSEDRFYLDVAEKTALYLLREMRSPEGAFYSSQDADSDGEEGGYYLFEPSEITHLLGKARGEAFNRAYDITETGNFKGKSIPNLLRNEAFKNSFDASLPRIYDYRRQRSRPNLDDKILTAWNALTIAALCRLYRAGGNANYLEAAKKTYAFLSDRLCRGDTLFVSFRSGKCGEHGFLDDYAAFVYALTELYGATLDERYLREAQRFCRKALSDFFDAEQGGFYLCGRDSESLILRPKESYDGAMPSGNSLMAFNLVRLSALTADADLEKDAKLQLRFLSAEAARYPAGHAMFLLALSDALEPPPEITVVLKSPADRSVLEKLPLIIPLESLVRVLSGPDAEFSLKNGENTFYVCKDHRCMPPVSDLHSLRALL